LLSIRRCLGSTAVPGWLLSGLMLAPIRLAGREAEIKLAHPSAELSSL
jgi:hypothetical protein